ncbi:cell wall hydrolase/autolysin [Oscillochloris trichoides DG-6]|uniref:Cell wall hydrolase/autolysin n=1 Tax=Oscillochloris trichoides DG-6 TaxID=765420 RepID=E1ICI4_9CHLR|nr:N-acetylmuramoyl-L-alanine amidase [Oscillochloris trichoides]EFO81112.1 cell wall hydrolase/autolysin [Oscillochloris trichoides DG-6]
MLRRIIFPLCLIFLVGCTQAPPVALAPTGPIIPVAEAAGMVAPTPPPLTPTLLLPTPTPVEPTRIPTPAPPRVGLQVGHLNADELPDELARFRTSTGARYNDVTEAELNADIARRVQVLLEAEGVLVDLLPATIPPSYAADAFITIHADGSNGTAARGWKVATPWRASRASQQLLAAVAASYGPATGLPEDVGGITVNMRGYYAFNNRRHTHAIARTTPAIIIETGFMTNAADRAVLFGQPDRVARGIAEGILTYLAQRDPHDSAALLPPELPNLRVSADGAVMRVAPNDEARRITNLEPGQRIFALDQRDGWYQIFARDYPSAPGWVRADQVEVSTEPFPFPTTTNP